MGGIRSQCQGSKGIHYNVDPKQLNCREHGSLRVGRHSGDKRNDDSGDVDGDLKLQELLHGVIDAATPHDRANNRREVIIHEDNIRGLFGHFGPRDSHGETDMGFLESERVI